MIRAVLASAAAALLCACGTSGQSKECSLIGCDDGVTIDFGPLASRFPGVPLTVHVCLDAACQDATVTATSCEQVHLSPTGPTPSLVLLCWPTGSDGHLKIMASAVGALASPTSTTVSVSIVDTTGATVLAHASAVPLAEARPNGPDCEPTCHQGSLSLAE